MNESLRFINETEKNGQRYNKVHREPKLKNDNVTSQKVLKPITSHSQPIIATTGQLKNSVILFREK